MRRFLLCCLAICASYIGSAQQTNIKFSHLGLKEGLSQSEVLSITQDSSGLMWFGTQDGLNRYNGFEFDVFFQDLTDSTSLSNSFIHQIYQDKKGNIWVATENGLNIYNPFQQNFKNILSKHQFSRVKINVWSITENKSHLWVGIENQLVKVDKQSYKIEVVPLSLSTSTHNIKIRKLFFVNDNQLLIGTEGNGFISYDVVSKNTQQYYSQNSGLKNNSVKDFYIHSEDVVWVGTDNGIYLYNTKHNNVRKHKILNRIIKNSGVNVIYEDRSGIIWIGTETVGLFKYKSLDDIEQYKYNATITTSLSSNKINVIYEDITGIIWIGTQSGVDKFDKQKLYFKHYQHWQNISNTLNHNMVWCIYEEEARNSTLYVGTKKGLNVFDKYSGTSFTVVPEFENPDQQKNESVYSLYRDSRGTLYAGTDGGLFYYENKQLFPLKFEGAENTGRVYKIIEDNRGRLWVGTKEGLSIVSSDRKSMQTFKATNEPGSLHNEVIRTIIQDDMNRIWVGTDGGGLARAMEDRDSIFFITHINSTTDQNSLSHNSVLSLENGENGIIWVGTFGGGLNKFDTRANTFTRYTEKDGLSNNVIYGVLIDKNGNLWMSTNKGLSSFNISTEKFKNFEESDGLQSNEFNTGAYFRSKTGKMFFGGVNGFNSFYPEDVRVNTSLAKPIITNFYLFNKPVEIGQNSVLKKHISQLDELILKYRENVISFEFAALHYGYPLKNQHAYKLENFNEDWVYIGNNRVANYTNLDPGEYVFKVKVANGDGIWNEEIAQINITVLPPFWATWWFRTLAILVILAIIYSYYITKINRVKAQKLLLEVQVRERTYEVLKQKEEIEKQKGLLEVEKDKAEKLLLNILPEETVEELKAKGKATARQYRLGSIMFTDFKSFTQIAENTKPTDLVAELDRYFVKFDEIIEKYDIEKIKTIGDAYMCAGGIPIRNKSNPIDIVLAALEIQRFMGEDWKYKEAKGVKPWGLRVGIHTGEIIAGVVGTKRFAYDIWGDSVNIASRVEAGSDIGKVNISGATYQMVKEFFVCEYRGKIPAKNKGHIDMFYVHKIRPELSVDGNGIEPNELFQKYVDLHIYSGINYRKAEKYIVNRLEKELPKNLYYHDLRHTLDVCAAVERLALMEGVEGDDIFILKTAALYHDAGFVKQYSNNEEIGAALAKEVLPRFGYTNEQIEVIHQLINATKIPHSPNNKLEEIICDADLDYLGGDEFHTIADKLKRELMERDMVKSDVEWDQLQIKFLEQHKYFTQTAIKLRKKNKQQRIAEIKERLKDYPTE